MDFRQVAGTVFDQTRTFYASGEKSSNKIYDSSASKNQRRNRADKILSEFRNFVHKKKDTGQVVYPTSKPPIERGSILFNLQWKAGNCQELADVACYLAYKQIHRPQVIFEVSLSDPGDHVFCLLSSPDYAGTVNGRTMKDLAGLDRVFDYDIPWAVDPWANVCCPIDQYPAQMAEKMDKWTSDGKRIAWMGKDGKKPGWYPPKGEYADGFLESKAILHDGFDTKATA